VTQENVWRSGVIATIDRHPGESSHVRPRASDFASGDELLSSGRLLDPRALVAAAAADVATLHVFRVPRLQILSTGDELAEPGTARDRQDAIPDSISLGVVALAEQWGATCVGRSRLRDDLSAMQAAAEAAVAGADVVVVTGGASVGEKDFAKAMFEALGMELLFSKIAIKPGKPAWLGRVRDTLVLGLPGNPSSAFVTARLLLVPLLAAMQGRQPRDALNWSNAVLASAMPACGDRETFHRAALEKDAVRILSFQESHVQKALSHADVLVRQPAHCPAIAAGTRVEILTL
jgi:molybdopterin molybdotransferase